MAFANNASVIKLKPKKATVAMRPMERKLMAQLDDMHAMVEQLQKQLADTRIGLGTASEIESNP